MTPPPVPEAGELTAERLAELRRVAEAANHGPWSEDADTVVDDSEVWGDIVCMAPDAEYVESLEYWSTRRAHIATFDPPTVLALIAALQATQARLGVVSDELDNSINQQGLADDLMNKAYRAAKRAEQEAARWRADADAPLIAAAPDLLVAAKRALNVLKATGGNSIRPGNVLGALDAAIAKAEGRS